MAKALICPHCRKSLLRHLSGKQINNTYAVFCADGTLVDQQQILERHEFLAPRSQGYAFCANGHKVTRPSDKHTKINQKSLAKWSCTKCKYA